MAETLDAMRQTFKNDLNAWKGNLLKLQFEAEQKRSRQIEKALNEDAFERIGYTPFEKKETAPEPQEGPAETERVTVTAPQQAAPETPKVPTRMARLSRGSLRDAIILSEIISKPVSKR